MIQQRERIVVTDPMDPDQVMELVGYDFGFSRRGFLQVLGAGLLISVAVATEAEGQERPGRGGGGGGRGQQRPVRLDSRIHIGEDGAITVMTGKVEGGQGSRAQIAQAAAEELGVAASMVKLVMADTALVPDDGGTYGSRTTPSTVPSVRQACAAVRRMLVELAAQRQGGDPAKMVVKDGAVGEGEKRVTYADLAGSKGALANTAPADVALTPVEAWEVMGKTYQRPNAREILTGAHQYPRDVRRPGMVYGRVLRPESFGAKLAEVYEKAASKVEGAAGVRDGEFVGVVAPSSYAAKKALLLVDATARWEPRPHPASAELAEYLRAHTREPVPANPYAAVGAKSLSATYYIPYVQHVPLEPRAAVAEWGKDGTLTVWTATQNPFGVRRELAGAFHLPEEKVRVIVPDFGGAYGGKHTGECAVEAARLARGAGKPVSLQWTRQEEFTWASFRPAAVMDVAATLGDSGEIAGWYFVNLNSGGSGVETPYRVGQSLAKYVACDAPLRHGSYRALASTANNFARESFMDELAALAKKDPLEFRLAHLENPRLRAVLELAAEKFDWKSRRAAKRGGGTGIGLACATEKGSFVATCAEVEMNRDTGRPRVTRIVQAYECGKVINPENLLSQNQGAIVQALGPILYEASEFEGGRMLNATLSEYRVPHASDVPASIEVHFVDRPDLPSVGAGETPLIAVAPAVGNAVFEATGTRVREMPIRV